MRTLAAVLALVACVHAGMWALLQRKETAPNFTGQLASVSYSPFAHTDDPENGPRPTVEQIRADLKAIAPYTRAIRTYSSTDGSELVPPIAAEFGLKVTVGAWISKDQDRNDREIRSALDLARRYSNVNAIVVGNETMLRDDMSVDDLIKLIQTVKRSSPVPVTTAEIWTNGSTIRNWLLRSISSPRTSCPIGKALTLRTRSTIPSSSTTSCARCIPASGS